MWAALVTGDLPQHLLVMVTIAILCRMCWTDFFYLKIWNRDVLALLGATVAFLILARPDDFIFRLGLGSILFTISFVFWLLRTLGAGDAKLLGVVGCLIEPSQAILFLALTLLFGSLLFLFYKYAGYLQLVPQFAGRRLLELVETGRIPYGVPISCAAIACVANRLPIVL